MRFLNNALIAVDHVKQEFVLYRASPRIIPRRMPSRTTSRIPEDIVVYTHSKLSISEMPQYFLLINSENLISPGRTLFRNNKSKGPRFNHWGPEFCSSYVAGI